MLVQSALESTETIQCYDGNTRAKIYILSYMTGLRRGELAGLTPDHFNLGGTLETVTIPATISKHRKNDTLPLHPELVLPQLPADLQGPSVSFIIGTEFCKYFVFGDAHWDYSTYDLAHWSRDSRLVASFVNAGDPDLAAFRAGGGKLILWHGWCDGLATPLKSIQYYEDVEKRDPQVRDFFRLFMLPGVRHCGQGTGPDHVDWLATIVQWVEHDRAPNRIVAAKLEEDGTATWTRPLYPYPQRVVYKGTGSVQDESSFISDHETAK
jgi:hypothetical protein